MSAWGYPPEPEWVGQMEFTCYCRWDGQTEAEICNRRLLWTCPACGEEHDDPSPDLEEDNPYLPDNWKEAEGLA